MDYRFSEEDESFRTEVRDLILSEVPSKFLHGLDEGADDRDPEEIWQVARQFAKKLAERKWLAMAWPVEYGGLAASYTRQMIFNHEMSYYGAPGLSMGASWIGPALMLYGSEEQKRKYLPGITSAEDIWCTLYSEPGAGSDLAGLQVTALRSGDDFIVNGTKIWNSGAHKSDYGWLAARTDPDAPKHKGISVLVVDMKSPGITIQRITNIVGDYVSNRMYFGLNRVIFDNVRVPKENLVGELNRGWYQVAVALGFERSGIGGYAAARREIERYIDFAKEHPELVRARPAIRHELMDRWVEMEVGYQLAYRITWLQENGQIPDVEASISKLYGADLAQRIARTGVALMGMYGGLRGGPNAYLEGHAVRDYLASVQATIGGGTNEIQRNIVARRALGLSGD